MADYLVAITGASGAAYGVRLVSELLRLGNGVELVVSPAGFLLLKEELGIDCAGLSPAAAGKRIAAFMDKPRPGARGKRRAGAARGKLTVLAHDDLTGAAASGSSLRRTMIICPCSMGTLGRIAAGVSGNLIERAADCVLKERGTLVLVPRETPLGAIHLENMLKLARLGTVILPAMPAFYHGPRSIDDMVDFIAGKVLDILGVENSLYKRWKK